ncbi:MAG: Nif3-like dinuclear metal center hexameric protein [Chloroflexota bacterium]|nr:Nif3-like dinuclear metal center hexameric protein [Chloroflexota bacterium]MDE2898511.1 Nif3-like dinuclear metal center hexameric protein [Chloroflexota bacterium]
MPEPRDDLVTYLNRVLEVQAFPDYGPMGLQVHGRRVVRRVVTAVSASRALFEAAAERDAGIVVVHHGLFWDSDSRVIDPMLRERLRVLFDYDISLAAYHLALDGHPTLGNNARIIQSLGFQKERVGFAYAGERPVGWFGSVSNPVPAQELAQRARDAIGPLHAFYANGPAEIRRIAVCSGGGPKYFQEAVAKGCDAFITGDLFEPVEMWSRELGVHFLAAGHYATEVFGVQALAELISAEVNCEADFLDLPTNA